MLNIISNANVLVNSFLEARKNCSYKNSVQSYEINLLRNIRQTQKELKENTYRQQEFYDFFLNERGKERYVRAINFYDRVVQRALCDQLVKVINPLLIYDNGASTKHKGLAFSRGRFETHIHKYYRKYGSQGYILLIDFKKFYDNVNHHNLIKMYKNILDEPEIIALIKHLVSSFTIDISNYDVNLDEPFDMLKYAKTKPLKSGKRYLHRSLGIGSQISQVSALYFPHLIDNYIKIVKGIHFYGRYMDDSYIICNDKNELKEILKEITVLCGKLGIFVNEKKTHIFKLDKGFTFLKIRYRLTDTGHLVRIPDKGNFIRERRKLKSFKRMLDNGEMTLADIQGQYISWRGNLTKYDCHRSLRNMDKLYMELFDMKI